MANCCCSNVRIDASRESIDKLMIEFEKAFELDGGSWLGNLIKHIGEGDRIDKDEDYSCRGHISDICRENETQINLFVETAWIPILNCIKIFCDHFVDDAELLYSSIEEGCEIYLTNIPELAEMYYVDFYSDIPVPKKFKALEELYEVSEKDLKHILVGILEHDDKIENLIKELCDIIYNDYESICLSINKFQYQDIEDCY